MAAGTGVGAASSGSAMVGFVSVSELQRVSDLELNVDDAGSHSPKRDWVIAASSGACRLPPGPGWSTTLSPVSPLAAPAPVWNTMERPWNPW